MGPRPKRHVPGRALKVGISAWLAQQAGVIDL